MPALINLLVIAVAVALVVAFVILFMGKSGMRDFLMEHAHYRFMYNLLDCDFCLSFWLSLIISVALSFVFANEAMLIIPLFSTTLARYLL